MSPEQNGKAQGGQTDVFQDEQKCYNTVKHRLTFKTDLV